MTQQKKKYIQTYIRTAWPVVLETVLVSLVTSIDTMMVGGLGTVAISAVGLTQQPHHLMLLPVVAFNVGIMTVVGRLKGAQKQIRAVHCLKMGILISFGLSLMVVVLMHLLMRYILLFAGAQADTIEPAMAYFRYVTCGMAFRSVGLTLTAAQRGIGKTNISLISNLTANAVNIFLNYCLIYGRLGFPALGIRGAAIATMVSYVVFMLIALASVCRPSSYLYLFQETKSSNSDMQSIYHISKGSILDRFGHRLGMMLYFKIVAELGTAEFAAYSICSRFTNLSYSLGDGLGIAAAALVAQSMGAKQNDQAVAYSRIGIKIAFFIGSVFMMMMISLRSYVLPMFSSDDTVLRLCEIGAVSIAIAGLVHIPEILITGVLRGAGDTHYLARMSLISTMIFRPLSAWILADVLNFGVVGVYISLISEITIRFVFTAARMRTSKWLTER